MRTYNARVRSGVDRQTRRIVVAGVLLAVLVVPGWAGGVTVDRTADHIVVRYELAFSAGELRFGQLHGFDTVALPDASATLEPGQPMLPARLVRIAVPSDMRVTGVRVVAQETSALPGSYLIYPAQPPQPVSDPLPLASFARPDPRTYGSDAPYPAQPVTFVGETDLAGQAIALLRVCPVQYVPTQRKLLFHSALRVELEGTTDYQCGDYLPASVSARGQQAYVHTLSNLVANPGDVEPQRLGAAALAPRSANYDYLIITQAAWVPAFQPLADWKTKKGVPAQIVTTEEIAANGTGATLAEKIRNYVIGAHDSWGTMFFLLGGDANVVPYGVKTILGDDIPNDTYYADYDDDWMCEVNVGRASVSGTTDIQTFVNKVLAYEKNPPATDYATTAFFLGYDLSAGGVEGENLMEAVRTLYLPGSWTYRRSYDSDVSNHWNDAIAGLNQGSHLVNHSDHANSWVMGVGYVNHNWLIDGWNMAGLTNGARQGIFYTLGCDAGDYTADYSIAEQYVRNASGGGVAFMGNTRYGWFAGGYSDYYSAAYDRSFFRGLFAYGHTTLGDCFSFHKQDAYDPNEYYLYIFTELTLLGDPELPIWTADPQSLIVAHRPAVYAGATSNFVVQVWTGSRTVGDATVCLWKAGDVYELGTTNTNGVATFQVAPSSGGPLYVTVTKANFRPSETAATVAAGAVLGDLDCDAAVNNQDIDGFVLALFDPTGYAARYPFCDILNGDMNGDGIVNNQDIDGFIAALLGP